MVMDARARNVTTRSRRVTFIAARSSRQCVVRVNLICSLMSTGRLRKRMPCDTHVKEGPVPELWEMAGHSCPDVAVRS